MGKKGKGRGKGDRRERGKAEELQAEEAWRQAEAEDAMIGGWMESGVAGSGRAGLVRQHSRRGPAYDALLERGIPHHMLRRAWVVADGDPEGAMAFVRANFDQPGTFWHPSDDQTPEFRSAPPPANGASSEQDQGATLRRVRSAGSQPRRSGAQWQHTQPEPEPAPAPDPEEMSSVPDAMLAEQPLHDLLAQSHAALAAATKPGRMSRTTLPNCR